MNNLRKIGNNQVKEYPMKVIHIISSRKIYGAEMVMINLCRRLLEDGIDTEVWIIDGFKEENELEKLLLDCRIPCQRVISTSKFDLKAIIQIRRMLKDRQEEKFVIVHTHNYKANFYVFLAHLFLRRIVWIITVHGWSVIGGIVLFYEILDRFIVRFADRVVAVSKNVVGAINLALIPSSKIAYIPNGIELKGDLRRDIDNMFCVGFVGRLEREKNFEFVMHSLASFCKKMRALGYNSFECIIAGDGSMRDWAQTFIKENGLLDEIKLLGKLSADEMDLVYKKIDCLFIPSLREGLPMVVLESLSWQIPIVGSSVSLRDVLDYECNGIFVVKNLDVDKACDNLLNVAHVYFEDRDKYVDWMKDLKGVVENFSLELMVERYKNLYYNISNYG